DGWWLRWPKANIGVATGAESGVGVLDVDGDQGRTSYLALPPLPPTWGSRTARGEHVWFKHPGRVIGNRAALKPGRDLRGDGGYVLAPPSRHASGTMYEWIAGPGDVDLAEMPKWLLELALRPERQASSPLVDPERWAMGTRNDKFWRLTRSLLAQGFPK